MLRTAFNIFKGLSGRETGHFNKHFLAEQARLQDITDEKKAEKEADARNRKPLAEIALNNHAMLIKKKEAAREANYKAKHERLLAKRLKPEQSPQKSKVRRSLLMNMDETSTSTVQGPLLLSIGRKRKLEFLQDNVSASTVAPVDLIDDQGPSKARKIA